MNCIRLHSPLTVILRCPRAAPSSVSPRSRSRAGLEGWTPECLGRHPSRLAKRNQVYADCVNLSAVGEHLRVTSRRAEAVDHGRGDGQALELHGILRVEGSPHPDLAALDRKLPVDGNPMRYVEAGAPKLGHLGGDL